MIDLFETIAQATKPCNIPVVKSRFGDYNKSVMQRAWRDYKIKKAHKSYESGLLQRVYIGRIEQ